MTRRSARPCARAGPARASACSRTASGIADSAILVRYSSTTEASSSPSSLRIDSICLRRKYSRCWAWAPDSTSSRIRRADLELGEALALQLERQLQPLGDVDGLQQPLLVGERDVGAVAGGVGQRPWLGDRAQERRDPPVVAAQLEDLLDHGAVVALELADPLARRERRRRAARPRSRARRCGAGEAVPARPRRRPVSVTALMPPGRRPVSTTSAIVPMRPYSPSGRGSRKTCSASPTSAAIVAVIPGNRIESSSGTSSSCISVSFKCLGHACARPLHFLK